MIRIKRGDTFAFYADITSEDGTPLITDVDNLKSQVRDTDYNLISELTVAQTDIEGRYLFTADTTADWSSAPGSGRTLLMDIEINIGGQISSSRTVKINVVKDVTS